MQSRLTTAAANFAATVALTAAAAFAGSAAQAQTAAAPARKPAPTLEDTYRDIQATLGLVPGFFRAYPEQGLPGAWQDFKQVQVSESTRIPPKMKQLIGLAVSAQVPCGYCVYFHTEVAKAYGATPEEIKEAVALAAISRHWSTVLNGMAIDMAAFKGEVDASLRIAAERAAKK